MSSYRIDAVALCIIKTEDNRASIMSGRDTKRFVIVVFSPAKIYTM